ncbi:MAG: lysophospholipid acyltransferase family protein [Candidatus Brocadiales bacterium]
MKELFRKIAMVTTGMFGPVVLRLLCWTLRIEERPPISPRLFQEHALGKVIITFWHSGMLVMAYKGMGQDIKVLISEHVNGEYITRVVTGLGLGVIRGSTTRGASRATANMVKEARKGSFLAITPDGPRGPKEVVQPGVIFMAKKTGLPILPVSSGFSNCWRMRSWDGFRIPRPFSKVIIAVGEPITVPPDAGEEEMERYRQVLEDTLNALAADAEAAAGG